MEATLLSSYVMPLAVLVSATATTATATFAYKLWQLSKLHDRALFGEEKLDGHDGIISEVERNRELAEENQERSEENEEVLTRQGLF